jgi:hypothetical protein
MKKWILIGSVLIIIFIVFLLVGLSQLGPVIKNAVNTYGPQMTKTEVRLGDVSISLFSGEAKLKDFFSGQPRGIQITAGPECGRHLCGCGRRVSYRRHHYH